MTRKLEAQDPLAQVRTLLERLNLTTAARGLSDLLASIFTLPKGLTFWGRGPQAMLKRSRRPFHHGTGVRSSSRPEAMRMGLCARRGNSTMTSVAVT